MFSSLTFSYLLVAGVSAAPAGSGSCKLGFLNTVFNTGVGAHASWPDPIWGTLTSYGIQNFITFSLLPINQNSHFDVPGQGPARTNDVLEAARIPIVMDKNDVSNGLKVLSWNSTPPYLELYNEPDLSYQGATTTEDPIPSIQDLSPIIKAAHPNTKYISPALAFPNSPDWLPVFFDKANCPNCLDQIEVLAMHIYDPNVDNVVSQVTEFVNRWPGKRIWITEMGPYNGGPSGCTFDLAGVANYASTLIPRLNAIDRVDKIFWNCGDAEPADVCNPSLTNEDGSATDVLKALGGACGFTGA